ncbi:MAG: hypothetical protein LBG44_04490 [Gemmatimonadota bacterium]|jgi:hypothetical protein|nr:hypothetical protein [Gemmatimonadota bacterium]
MKITALSALALSLFTVSTGLAAQACFGFPEDARSGFVAAGAGYYKETRETALGGPDHGNHYVAQLSGGMEIRSGVSAIGRAHFRELLELGAVAASIPFCPSVTVGREFTRDGFVNRDGFEHGGSPAALYSVAEIGVGHSRRDEHGNVMEGLFFRGGVVWREEYGRWPTYGYSYGVDKSLRLVALQQFSSGKIFLRSEGAITPRGTFSMMLGYRM